ncbi:MAG: phosphate acyltransferase PlsX [bacterium]
MRIAVDAMGGDHAPERIVAGAVEAAAGAGGRFEVVLVGDELLITERFSHMLHGLPIEIVHAPEIIEMDEAPAAAMRRKRDASIPVAMRLHRDGEVDAVVSAGNTGAAMASALLTLGRLRGVHRPAIASLLPSEEGATLVLDVGANPAVSAENLLQFALMGSLYTEYVFDVDSPRVGLVNIGEEENKGTETAVRAHALLKASGLNFVGNVQGRDILAGGLDVAVCDGFTGNVILKFAEGIVSLLTAGVKRGLSRSPVAKLGAVLMSPVFRQLKKDLDYEEYGGAPLLGIDGVVIIGHGRSSAKAIRNAVRGASRIVAEGLNDHIKLRLDEMHAAELPS